MQDEPFPQKQFARSRRDSVLRKGCRAPCRGYRRTDLRAAELNSFTKAAQSLDYSQSTVSFQIKQLETELNCLLFERINHSLQLTAEGQELVSYATQVCRLTDEFHQHRKKDEPISGYVHIVVPDSVCEAMMLDNYADFFQQNPGIRLRFSTADTEDMFRLLERNEADGMLTLDSHVYQTNFVIAKEVRIGTHFYAAADSPLSHRTELQIQDILDYPMILTEKGMGYRRVLDDMLAQRSIEIEPVLEIGRTDIITKILENGSAVSFLPDFVAKEKVEGGRLVKLNVVDLNIDIWQQMIYHRNKWISRPLETFIQYVCDHEFSR